MSNPEQLVKMEIDGKELREFVKTLEFIEPGLRKQFVKDIKSGIKPLADTIAAKVPVQAPLSGMRHRGRTAWAGVTASVYASPGGGKSGSVARIEIYGRGDKKAALKIADLAGTRNKYNAKVSKEYASSQGRTRSHQNPSQGDTMIEQLQRRYPLWRRKGGRFVWSNFLSNRGTMIDVAIKIMDSYAERVNRKGKP
jgi:hypothetical protein